MTTYYLTNEDVRLNCVKDIKSRLATPWNDEEGNKGQPFEVTIKPASKSKTTRQRNYFHDCVRIISDYTGNPMDEEKMRLKYSAAERGVIPMLFIDTPSGRKVYPQSSERLNVGEYSALIDITIEAMAIIGLTPPPTRLFGYDL